MSGLSTTRIIDRNGFINELLDDQERHSLPGAYRIAGINSPVAGVVEEYDYEEEGSITTTQAVDMTTLTRTSDEIPPISQPGAYRVRGINSIATQEYYEEESASMNATSQVMEILILTATTVDDKIKSHICNKERIRESVIRKAALAVKIENEKTHSQVARLRRGVIILLSVFILAVVVGVVISLVRDAENDSEPFNNNKSVIYGTKWIPFGQKLLASYGKSDFGESIDLNEDAKRLAIGSNNQKDAKGAVKVMDYGGALVGWMQLGNVIEGNFAGENFGSSVQLNSEGNFLVVGGFGSNKFRKGAKYHGHITSYKYFQDHNQWVPIGESIRGDEKGDRFGISLSISLNGTTWIAGADNYFRNGKRDGYAKVYSLFGKEWKQKGSVISGINGSMTGHAVAMSGDGQTVCVGDPKFRVKQGFRPGRVRCFLWWEDEWKRKGKSDILGEDHLDYAGYSLSLNDDGNIVAIGAPQRRLNEPSLLWGQGSVLVYKMERGDWKLQGKKITGERIGDKVGHKVELNGKGDVLAYTGRGHDTARANDTGVVKVKQCINSEWVRLGGDINGESADDFFGETVALSNKGNILASSANWDFVEYVSVFSLH
mmetsp:Transcript_30734/g.35038  ORF Transcript_30734/g.35038 Transcript_30734/m.35038 type:complete len:601 (+) Transcript_30734:181-1983(+)|eukprot:CAMPEP_0194133314 /NCGR_PEP_ID=MMETSP0152-20130528/3540_1 /TAXON_ID=1049557 /ORGANISM="Thalassiothrix antarctica, Strain L6-D1" /LENGTH=600 /DNA_ID=CAMNT_0038828609 /DNA_START=81 /DNA_END=1883 /DNA_ORIENTATION=-